jgi:hypothetical protein
MSEVTPSGQLQAAIDANASAAAPAPESPAPDAPPAEVAAPAAPTLPAGFISYVRPCGVRPAVATSFGDEPGTINLVTFNDWSEGPCAGASVIANVKQGDAQTPGTWF